jgi:hypothetical protein
MINSIFNKHNELGNLLEKQRKEREEEQFKKLSEKSDTQLLRILEDHHLSYMSSAQIKYKNELIFAKSDEERGAIKERLNQTLLAKDENDYGAPDSEVYMARKILRNRNL